MRCGQGWFLLRLEGAPVQASVLSLQVAVFSLCPALSLKGGRPCLALLQLLEGPRDWYVLTSLTLSRILHKTRRGVQTGQARPQTQDANERYFDREESIELFRFWNRMAECHQ